MISKETATLISLAKTGIVLNSKSRNIKQIPFEDVAKIYISIQQRKLILKTFLIGYFIFTFFCLQYLNLELCIFSVLIFGVNFIVMNTLDFKTYRLQIVLKNNSVIEKRFPKKLKYEFITLINEVRNHLPQPLVPAN